MKLINYKAINSMINTLVAFRSLFDSSPFALRYAFVLPPLCLRYVIASLTEVNRVHNGGRSSSLRRMNEE